MSCPLSMRTSIRDSSSSLRNSTRIRSGSLWSISVVKPAAGVAETRLSAFPFQFTVIEPPDESYERVNGARGLVVVEPGEAYQIEPTAGSAGRVRLKVFAGETLLGDSEATALAQRPFPPVRFKAPPVDEATGKRAAVKLEVRGGFDGGG